MRIKAKLFPALLASVFALGFAALSTPSSAAPSAASDADVTEGTEPSAPAAPAGSSTSSPHADPTSAADCKAIAADSTADAPPSDITTTPAPTGSASDRLAAIAEVVKRKRPAFRCCFDIWAGKIPEARLYTKVAFTLKLDPTGKVVSAAAKQEADGPAVATDVGSCLEGVGTSLTYPPSPSQKETTYVHHFDFKPRKHH